MRNILGFFAKIFRNFDKIISYWWIAMSISLSMVVYVIAYYWLANLPGTNVPHLFLRVIAVAIAGAVLLLSMLASYMVASYQQFAKQMRRQQSASGLDD